MDFLRRLEPGHASTAAAARPALPPLMAAMPVAPLASLSSRLASRYAQPIVASPAAAGAWPEGMATAPHEASMPPRQAASQAPFDGALPGPVQAAFATLEPQAHGALEPLRPLPQAALSSAVQSAGAPQRARRAEPSRVPRQEPQPALSLSLALRRAASVAPWRHSGPPLAEAAQPLSAAALQARAPASPTLIAAPAPALQVTIDRIEVRAAAPAAKPAPAQRQPKPPAVSLADYLRSGARPKVAS